VLVHRFPFAILYRVERVALYVIAVAHLHRRPNYWRGRA
jgi:hypothetical protein